MHQNEKGVLNVSENMVSYDFIEKCFGAPIVSNTITNKINADFIREIRIIRFIFY